MLSYFIYIYILQINTIYRNNILLPKADNLIQVPLRKNTFPAFIYFLANKTVKSIDSIYGKKSAQSTSMNRSALKETVS